MSLMLKLFKSSIKLPRSHGLGGDYAYGIFLPPTNPEYAVPDGALPPLMVAMHGGPTRKEGPGVYMRDQFGPSGVMLWCRSTTSALHAMARGISTCLTSSGVSAMWQMP